MIEKLIEQLQKLPSVGPKMAMKLATHIMKQPNAFSHELARAITETRDNYKLCVRCCNYSETEICSVCSNHSKDKTIICVVAEHKDFVAINKTNEYKGLFHILHGKISPMEGIAAEDIKIPELLNHIQLLLHDENIEVKELILAIDESIQGVATSLYISKLFKLPGVKISQIAFGVSSGTDIDEADSISLMRALEGRKNLSC